jgi:hypothetical protein
MSERVKIVVFVPVSHTDTVREAMGKAGTGIIGDYTFCSFSSKGIGRFLPGNTTHPTIGEVGKFESVEEERIEVVCEKELLSEVVAAIKAVHPYEEVALDIYPLLNI